MIDRANDHYALDITRARTMLKRAPRRLLRETLPKLVAALKADPLGWYRERSGRLHRFMIRPHTAELHSERRANRCRDAISANVKT